MGTNPLIIYLWHAKGVQSVVWQIQLYIYRIEFVASSTVCECLWVISVLYWVKNVKCITREIHNFDVIDSQGRLHGSWGGPFWGVCMAVWSYHKMSNLFAQPVVRVLATATFGQNAFLFDRPFGSDTPLQRTAATTGGATIIVAGHAWFIMQSALIRARPELRRSHLAANTALAMNSTKYNKQSMVHWEKNRN